MSSQSSTSEPFDAGSRRNDREWHEELADYFDRAIVSCRQAGFRTITLLGDTDFTQTGRLDHWDADGLRFVFGADAASNARLQAKMWGNKGLVDRGVTELDYRPAACRRSFRMIVVPENLCVKLGRRDLFSDAYYYFYLTNDRSTSAERLVRKVNDRLDPLQSQPRQFHQN